MNYLLFDDPTPANGVCVLARIVDELGRSRPDIPVLVVEGRGSEADLAACGLDLRVHGNVNLVPASSDLVACWAVTRVLLAPSTTGDIHSLISAALANGIPVIGSDRGPLPALIDGAGIALPLPERIGPNSRHLPTPEEIAPWVRAIIRLWDDHAFHEECRQRALRAAHRLVTTTFEARTSQFQAGTGTGPVSARPTRSSGLATNSKPSIESGIAALRRRWPDVRSQAEDDPIFVLAAGWRSGSTLLQRLIVHRCFLWGEPFGHSWMIDSLADHLRCFNDHWPEARHFHRGADPEALSRTFIANLYPSIQDLLRAHQGYFERLFAEPAHRDGAERWGLKEVRLSIDHAIYLKWLFPRAKFLFLIRNPYDAWRSYAARAAKGWRWFNRWPDDPLTVQSFAAHWASLAGGFLADSEKVGGLVVRYEELPRANYAAIEDYLGFPVSEAAGRANPSDGGPPPLDDLPDSDRAALEERLGALAASVGYAYQAGRSESSKTMTVNPRASVAAEVQVTTATTEVAASVRSSSDPADPRKCAVLVPVAYHVELACDEALRALERRGYTVRRVPGFSAIDQGRNQIATDALRDGFEELMWIDSDIAFEPDAVDRLRRHGLPITCGVYAKKGRRAFACNFPGDIKQISFGKSGGLVEIPYAAAGFLHTRGGVYDAVRERFALPLCNERGSCPETGGLPLSTTTRID